MPGIFRDFPFELVLASSSPRRREYLAHLGVDFTIEVPGTEEKQRSGEAPEAYVQRNSLEKALAVVQSPAKQKSQAPRLVVAADTIGVLDGVVLEKPLDAADAKRMLQQLSGRSHEVLTGLTVAAYLQAKADADADRVAVQTETQVVSTRVYFKPLSSEEIDFYVATGEPLDKAGAYGIQGGAGFMVAKIEGSYSNVVGLPMAELVAMLGRFL